MHKNTLLVKLPRGKNNNPVYANWYTLNGNGEMTGTTWITESGFLEGPIMITNTNSVGVVRDAVLPHQLKRIAPRVPIGSGIVGGRGENSAGDIFLAFSTANPQTFQRNQFTKLDELPNDLIDPLFSATVQATEEAIINAMIAAETMEGINGNKAYGLPHVKVQEILKKYNRLNQQSSH